jgi:circadian clock protein KaiC
MEKGSMTQDIKVKINQLPSGVSGLDEILGGGIPEFSFNIIAGAPGCGKTTLAHQFMFANATDQRPALYFTVLGEPALKMLRYQQQYDFFDVTKLNKSIRFVNLSQIVIDGGLKAVLAEISKQVDELNPGIVVVDSFRSVIRTKEEGQHELEVQGFMQQLAVLLTTYEATTFLIGEYSESELQNNPIFTVADGLLWLYQIVERNSVVRKLQVMKLRGQMSVPGMHTFRITGNGVQAFSRTLGLAGNRRKVPAKERLSTGIPELDEMMGGGLPG